VTSRSVNGGDRGMKFNTHVNVSTCNHSAPVFSYQANPSVAYSK